MHDVLDRVIALARAVNLDAEEILVWCDALHYHRQIEPDMYGKIAGFSKDLRTRVWALHYAKKRKVNSIDRYEGWKKDREVLHAFDRYVADIVYCQFDPKREDAILYISLYLKIGVSLGIYNMNSDEMKKFREMQKLADRWLKR